MRYVDAVGREITADSARAYAEERLGRELTPGELALDLVGLDVDLRDGKERLTEAIEREKRRAIEDVLRGGPGVLRVTQEMIEVMLVLVEAGRRHARTEIEKLTGRAFAEVEHYTIPRSFYDEHTARRGSLTGRVLSRDGSSVTVALDHTAWEILLSAADSYEGPLEEAARETARILRGNPPDGPLALSPPGGVPFGDPREIPGEDELGEIGDVGLGLPGRRRRARARREPKRELSLPAEIVAEIGIHEIAHTLLHLGPARLPPMLNAIRVRVNQEARGLIADRGLTRKNLSNELLDKLDEKIPGARDAASRLVSSLLIGGIGQIYELNDDLFPCFIYSAVMDGATCPVCRSFDGTRYTSWIAGNADLPGGGPNPRCLGDGRCRCRLVPCAPGEPVYVPERVGVSEADIDENAREELRAEGDPMQMLRDDAEAFQDIAADEEVAGFYGRPSESVRWRMDEMRTIGQRISIEADKRTVEERMDERFELQEDVKALKTEVDARNAEAQAYADERIKQIMAEGGAVSEYEEFHRLADDDEDYRLLRDDALLALDRLNEAQERLRNAEASDARARRENLLQVLGEIRPMGGQIDVEGEETGASPEEEIWAALAGVTDPGEDGARLIEDVARFYPRDWIERSNEKDRLRATYSPMSRGFYRDGGVNREDGSLIVVGSSDSITGDPDGYGVALHELGHRLEYSVDSLRKWTWAYWYSRTQGSDDPEDRKVKSMSDVLPGNYGPGELTYPDKFTHPYMGKFYGDIPGEATFEQLTMAMEWIFATPVGQKPPDDDMRNFYLGLLATVGRSRQLALGV